MKKVAQPTSQQCTDRATLEETEHSFAFATWHPQWGGYPSHAVVSFGREDDCSCPVVDNFHDGEFPGDTATTYHYCSSEQIIHFGLEILEKQVEKVRDYELDREWLDATIARLEKLRR